MIGVQRAFVERKPQNLSSSIWYSFESIFYKKAFTCSLFCPHYRILKSIKWKLKLFINFYTNICRVWLRFFQHFILENDFNVLNENVSYRIHRWYSDFLWLWVGNHTTSNFLYYVISSQAITITSCMTNWVFLN